MEDNIQNNKEIWVCPECKEEHIFPKSGPFKECCFKHAFADTVERVTEYPNQFPEIEELP